MRAMLLGLGLVALAGGGALPAADPAPTPSPPVDFNHLPWQDGEALTYHVYILNLDAADGTFTAKKKGDHWEFGLALASVGWVSTFYPFTGAFWSTLGSGLWRSVSYGQVRHEPKRTIDELLTVDYDEHLCRRENHVKHTTKTFPIADDAVDDIGTMLYHLRTGPWKPGDHRTVLIYESDSEKQAEVECRSRETKAFGKWPAQPMLDIYAAPTVGTHRRGYLDMWMTDDARHLPLHADVALRYGTFSIDLVKAEKTGDK